MTDFVLCWVLIAGNLYSLATNVLVFTCKLASVSSSKCESVVCAKVPPLFQAALQHILVDNIAWQFWCIETGFNATMDRALLLEHEVASDQI